MPLNDFNPRHHSSVLSPHNKAKDTCGTMTKFMCVLSRKAKMKKEAHVKNVVARRASLINDGEGVPILARNEGVYRSIIYKIT